MSMERTSEPDEDGVTLAESASSEEEGSVQCPLNDGEMGMLLQSLEDDPNGSAPLSPSVEIDHEQFQFEMKRSLTQMLSSISGESYYGMPLSPEDAVSRMPEAEAEQGLKWHALVIPDSYFSDGKLVRGLSKRDFDTETQEIKPRRPSLPITASSLFESLTKIEGKNGPRYIFHGVLNGWPALRCFELISLEQRRQASLMIPSPKEIFTGQIVWMHHWKASEEGAQGIAPTITDQKRIYRATLRGSPWTGRGWSPSSPGFAWWYEPHRPAAHPHVTYGTNMLTQLADDTSKCTHIHMVSHRYAVRHESPRDRLTYHSICLLEWDHGNYCTVVECAYLNGLGGYKGRSNWCEDRDSSVCDLYRAFPPEMVCPWRMTLAEIRCFDVPLTNYDEYKAFVMKHKGSNGRFVDPQFTFSHPARLTFRSKTHIAQYLLNYIQRDSGYAELKRNCQTFCADFCAFIAGKKDVVPFHPVSRIEYQNRTHLFLYEPDLYQSRDEKKKQKYQRRSTANSQKSSTTVNDNSPKSSLNSQKSHSMNGKP